MKLLRFGPAGQARPGMLDRSGQVRDLSAHLPDLGGAGLTLALIDRLRRIDPESLPLVEGKPRIAACLATVPNFFCVGLNYRLHAQEAGMAIPSEPILFSKATSSLSGPYDPVLRPRGATKLDYEVELGVVIGAECEYVSEAEALNRVAGYCVVNDISERAFQIECGGQWIKGKSARSFGPIGPWLVTPDEVPDPQSLSLWLSVNGVIRQQSTTADMIFSVAQIISYMSRFMRLMPGDIIATGTPAGVAMGMKPTPQWLVPGDEMRLGITGLGEQQVTVAQA